VLVLAPILAHSHIGAETYPYKHCVRTPV
jgi:hypothetical protein